MVHRYRLPAREEEALETEAEPTPEETGTATSPRRRRRRRKKPPPGGIQVNPATRKKLLQVRARIYRPPPEPPTIPMSQMDTPRCLLCRQVLVVRQGRRGPALWCGCSGFRESEVNPVATAVGESRD